jgi:hypothetical protein
MFPIVPDQPVFLYARLCFASIIASAPTDKTVDAAYYKVQVHKQIENL